MFQRFMPWWNAQKRKELAEKKEKEAHEKLRREEAEKLKAEERALNCQEENITEVDDSGTAKRGSILEEKIPNPHYTGDDMRNVRIESKDAIEQELPTDVKLNGESNGKDTIKNDVNKKGKVIDCKELNGDLNEEKILKNKATENKIKIDNKICMSNNNQIIPLNEKMFDLQTDFVAKKVLDT